MILTALSACALLEITGVAGGGWLDSGIQGVPTALRVEVAAVSDGKPNTPRLLLTYAVTEEGQRVETVRYVEPHSPQLGGHGSTAGLEFMDPVFLNQKDWKPVPRRWVQVTDAQGRILESAYEDFRDGAKTVSRTRWEYDDARRLVISRQTTEEGVETRTESVQDEQGRCIERRTFAGDQLVSTETYTYDSQGRFVASTHEVVGKPEEFARSQMHFDEQGRESFSESYYGGTLRSKVEYEYGPKGKLRETRRYYQQGKGAAEGWTVSTYGDDGNLVEEESFYEDGVLSGRTTYTRSREGMTIETASYDRHGRLAGRQVENRFDADSARTHRVRENYDADGRLVFRETVTAEVGQTVVARAQTVEEHSETTVTRFDSRGLPVAITRTVDDKPASRIEYRYEFDEKGSWVKATRWQAEGDGELTPVSVATRVITYGARPANRPHVPGP